MNLYSLILFLCYNIVYRNKPDFDTKGEILRILKWAVLGTLRNAVIHIPLSLIVAAVAWFFSDIIFGSDVDFTSLVRWLYIGFLCLDVFTTVFYLVYLIAVSNRVNASYYDVWEAKFKQKLRKEAFKDQHSFSQARSIAKLAEIMVGTVYGDESKSSRW
jgi:hypothetical protein